MPIYSRHSYRDTEMLTPIRAKFEIFLTLAFLSRPLCSSAQLGREFKGIETCGHAMIGKGTPLALF